MEYTGNWGTIINLYPLFTLISFNPYCPTCLSTGFVGVLGGLADPITPPLCVFSMGLPGRRSWVCRAKNERLIGLADLLVGFAVRTSSSLRARSFADSGWSSPYQCVTQINVNNNNNENTEVLAPEHPAVGGIRMLLPIRMHRARLTRVTGS
jgi:hypothetical protein